MDKELSIINESDVEKSGPSNKDSKKNKFFDNANSNYELVKIFNQTYEKNKFMKNQDKNMNEDNKNDNGKINQSNNADKFKNMTLSRKIRKSKTEIQQLKHIKSSPKRKYSSRDSIPAIKEDQISKKVFVRNDSQFTIIPLKSSNLLEQRRYTISNNKMLFKLDDFNIKPNKNDNLKPRKNSIPDPNNLIPKEANTNTNWAMRSPKKELTLEKVVEEINKPFLTFNNRRASSPNKYAIKNIQEKFTNQKPKKIVSDRKSTSSDKKSINGKSSQNKVSSGKYNYINYISNRDNSIFMDSRTKLKYRVKYLSRRIEIFIHVISFISYVKKEIITFGIKPKSIKPIIDENANENKTDQTFGNNSSKTDNFSALIKIKKKNKRINIPWYIITPEGRFYQIWNKFLLVVLNYFSIIGIFRIAFTNSYFNPNRIIYHSMDVFVESVFLLDIFINCLLAFYDYEGNFIISYKDILYSYFTSLWMILDILCSFPFFYYEIDYAFNGYKNGYVPALALIQFCRVLKLFLQINGTIFLQNLQQNIHVHIGFIKLLIFLLNSVMACHTFACVFYFSYIIGERNEALTWITQYNFQDDDANLVYLKTLYFSFTIFITVGYGDITAITNLCIWLIFSGIFYTSSLTSLSKIFLDYSSKKYMLNNKCLNISEIFRKAKLPLNIESDTIKYIKNTYYKNKETISTKEVKGLFSEIPSGLKYKIANNIYGGVVSQIHIFANRSKSFISYVVPLLQSLHVPANFYVYHLDEVPQKIYFIIEGSVKFLTENEISYTKYTKGNYFGEIEILRKTYRENSVKAVDHCFLLTLNKNIIWEDVIIDYTLFFQTLLENMIKRHNFNERMRDFIDLLIAEGNKHTSYKEYEIFIKNKKLISPNKEVINFNKHCFYIGMMESIKNGKDLNKLKEMFNENFLSENHDEGMKNISEINNENNKLKSSDGDININKSKSEINEIYIQKERRQITKKLKKLSIKNNINHNFGEDYTNILTQKDIFDENLKTEDNQQISKKMREIFKQNTDIMELLNIIKEKTNKREFCLDTKDLKQTNSLIMKDNEDKLLNSSKLERNDNLSEEVIKELLDLNMN